jgi:hypothetical protein
LGARLPTVLELLSLLRHLSSIVVTPYDFYTSISMRIHIERFRNHTLACRFFPSLALFRFAISAT